jgi:hypothetical protein
VPPGGAPKTPLDREADWIDDDPDGVEKDHARRFPRDA